MDNIVVVDFGGTLITPRALDLANEFRSRFLERSLPSSIEHSNPSELYKNNREFAERLTGLGPKMNILYRENDLDFIMISGENFLNQISTNLFQIGMYATAKELGKRIFPDGLIEELKRIQMNGYKLAIVSGVRTDIISGMLQISGAELQFDYIFGQPPILGVENKDNFNDLQKHGKITYIIGDKYSDIEPAKTLNAKSIFVKWGHASGGEETIADYVISSAEELRKIFL